jgi:hypothetical protein
MRINISVPDALAEEVRRRDIPVSAVCQRALREAVGSARAAEEADDILVWVEGDDPGPGSAAGKPTLTYKYWPVGKSTQLVWVLEYEEAPEGPLTMISGGTAAEPPIDWARELLRAARPELTGMGQITLPVGDPELTVGFAGRWLVEPDSEETRSSEPDHDPGAYWGVALTKRGRIAVYTGHCDTTRAASLHDYDTLGEAVQEGLPADIAALAADGLGQERILWRDI